ncbi:hypothetical protein F4808DRAFT_442713 [Astrocystis sublimbata]|nr:hypothetical protein F4808DRAFT_442713 [Astrocystis sublimbata]
MAQRSYESPMDWEYQNSAPMDPSSPFAQSTRQAHDKNPFGGSSTPGFSAYTRNGFSRTQTTPSKPLPPTPMQIQQQLQHQQSPSIFASGRLQRTTTAPPFRNPAFTTPRKPFDMDAMSELSAAESSPGAATDGSDFPDTPDRDRDHDPSFNMAHMTITPATLSRHKSLSMSLSPKKASGKGEIARTIFPGRDKIRKRKRYNADRDISGYRLPYLQPGEGDDSDYESDESTFQPSSRPQSSHRKHGRAKDGWFGSFLATIQRHPYAPSILGYWLQFLFSVTTVFGTIWIGWSILSGLRADFTSSRSSVRQAVVAEIATCHTQYRDNQCYPKERRLPALNKLCEDWEACMDRDPNNMQNMQLGAKNIVEIINEIVDTMSYKTLALLVLLFAIFLFSGRSLYKSTHGPPDFARHAAPPAPAYSQPADGGGGPQQIYWQAIQPQTPRHRLRHLPAHDETPDDTPDASPSPQKFKALMPPDTPSRRPASPAKTDRDRERGRSPAKSRSPVKRYA